MSNEELQLENIRLKNQLAEQQAKINKFLRYAKMIGEDLPEVTEANTDLELNLVDNLKDIIKESNKLR